MRTCWPLGACNTLTHLHKVIRKQFLFPSVAHKVQEFYCHGVKLDACSG